MDLAKDVSDQKLHNAAAGPQTKPAALRKFQELDKRIGKLDDMLHVLIAGMDQLCAQLDNWEAE